MRAIRRVLLGRNYEAIIADVQVALQCSRRTAERIYAGQAVSGDTTLAVLTDDLLGPALLEEALRRLPGARRATVAAALRDAADLARMEAEHEQLALKLAAARRPHE
jgi:hypothetical protein